MALDRSSGRNIVVTVTSNVSQFTAGMTSVRSQLTGLQSQMSSMFSSVGAGISSVSNNMILIGAAGTGFSQYITRLFSDSLPAVEEYYQAQARLISLMDDGTKTYQQMSQEAWAFAKAQSESSIFTATEVTKAMYIVAQAGYENADIMRVSTATMNLATAQAYDFAQTTDDVIGILNAFKLEAGDADRITNLLAATLTASKMSMEDITYGAKYASVAFNAMGYSAEEAFTAMSLLTDLGYKGENAGRILRDSLADLMDPTAEAMKIINDHHIVLYKNQSELDALAETYKSVESTVTALKDKQDALTKSMELHQAQTEKLNIEMQKLNLEQQKIRLKYNEDNPMLKSLEHEKDVLIDSRDAAKEYYNQLKAEQKERLSHIAGQKDTVSEIRREITAINNEMSYNRAQGYTGESPKQIGLAEQKKFLQDQLAEETRNLDTMRSDYNRNKDTIDTKRQEVTQSNQRISEQNKSIKKLKEELAASEQKEINEIEKKKIKIEEEKIAQSEKYQIMQESQRKLNDEIDIYNKKMEVAKKNLDNFVPTGLIEYAQILKNINAAKLTQGEMYAIFGKQSGPGMSDLTSDKTIEAWGTRLGKLIAGEMNQEALRQKSSVVNSLYGQKTIAATKFDNTTLEAVQNQYDPLVKVIKSITDPELLKNITTIKTDMLGGVIKGVEELLPTIKTGADFLGILGTKTWETIGAMTAMTAAIMYVVTPAILTLGVFGGMAGMGLRGLGALFGMGTEAATVAKGVGAAGTSSALTTELRNLIALLTPKTIDTVDDVVDMSRRGKNNYPLSLNPLQFDTRTPHEEYGDMLIHKAGLYNYGTFGDRLQYREHDRDSLGREMPLRDKYGRFVSGDNEQSELKSRIPQVRGSAANKYDLSGIDPLLYTRSPLIGKKSKDIIDPQLLKHLDELEDKLKRTGGVKTLAGGLDDVAIASAKAAPATGGLVARFAGLLTPVTSLIPFLGGGAGAGLAAGIGETAVAAPVATGLIGGLGATIAALAVPIAIIIGVIAALWVTWNFNLFGIQETTKSVVESIGKHFGWIIDWGIMVKDEFMKTFGSILEGLQDVWDGLANADLTQLVEGLGKIVGAFLRFGGQVLWYASEFIIGFFSSIIDGVIEGGPGALEAFGAFISDIPSLLMSAGQVLLYQAGNFGVSLIRSFLGIEVTEEQLKEQHRVFSNALDTTFKTFGLKSNLAEYANKEDTKRAARLVEKAQKDKERAANDLNKTVNNGLGVDKKSNDILSDLQKSMGGLTGANKNVSADMSAFKNMQIDDYTKLYTTMDTTGNKTDNTTKKVNDLNTAANQSLLFPNYDQNKFNGFNQNLDISTKKTNDLLAAMGQTNLAPLQQNTTTPQQNTTTPQQNTPTTNTPSIHIISGTAPKKPILEIGTTTIKPVLDPKRVASGFIDGLVGGLLTGQNPIIAAARGIAGGVAAFFPQSPAKTGPLVNLPTMGKNITKQIADGMRNEISSLKDVLNEITTLIDKNVSNDSIKITAVKKSLDAYNKTAAEASKAAKPMLIGNLSNANTPKIPNVITPPSNGWTRNDFGGRLKDTVNPNVNVTIKGDTKLTRTDLNKFGKRVFESVERSMHKAMG